MTEKKKDSETKRAVHYLSHSKGRISWDWWQENPIEIILIAFVLVLFFALPRQGCGVTDNPSKAPSNQTAQP